MLPPRPPSPPSGPPRGTNFSRRKLAAPSPPSPACTSITASSMNFMLSQTKKPCPRTGLARGTGKSASGRDHAHGLAVLRALLRELDTAGHFGEQGVIASDADVLAGMNLGAALAHDDRACRH